LYEFIEPGVTRDFAQIAREKLEALQRRRVWRRKLGARTSRGQPIMQHIIDQTLMRIQQQHVAEQTGLVPNPFSLEHQTIRHKHPPKV
jgi:hypothetical protein